MALSFDPISTALDLGGKIIDKIWPDPTKADEAKLELLKLAQSGELAKLTAETDLAKAQIATNTAEAQNASIFVSGWRPAIGWICGVALFFQFVARPFLEFAAHLLGFAVVYPDLAMGDLMTILLGMLGLGAMRMQEKLKGVATSPGGG